MGTTWTGAPTAFFHTTTLLSPPASLHLLPCLYHPPPRGPHPSSSTSLPRTPSAGTPPPFPSKAPVLSLALAL